MKENKVYKSQHKKIKSERRVHQKPTHQKVNPFDIHLRKSVAVGITLAGTSLLAAQLIGTNASATTINSSSTTTSQAQQQTVVKTQQDIEHEALLVIHGDLGNGAIRVQNLQTAGFDPVAVQDQVNKYYQTMGVDGAEQVANQVVQSSQTTSNTSGATQSSNNTGNTDSNVVNYAAQQMANATGVSASQWAAVIMRESSGNPDAVNTSSGAYGLFQLLGHGEYSGMSVDAQVSMAAGVYQAQGAAAWNGTW